MARKSKETMLAEKARREQSAATYRAAAYIRLSTEDFRHKTNVNTLYDQERFVTSYINTKGDMVLCDVFYDNGESGLSFQGPGFEAMIKGIRDGKYNCIVVKDLSRFPRDKWIIVENAHEAIISDELFNKTKSKECKSRKGVELGTTLFSGKVVCGCCGRNLYTWSKNHVLFCQTPTLSDNNPGCYDKKIHEDELIALVSDAIKFVMVNSKEKIARYRNDVTATTNELGSVKRELQNEVGKLDRLKLKKEKLFQKLMDGQMSDEEYMKLSDGVEREQIIVEDNRKTLICYPIHNYSLQSLHIYDIISWRENPVFSRVLRKSV